MKNWYYIKKEKSFIGKSFGSSRQSILNYPGTHLPMRVRYSKCRFSYCYNYTKKPSTYMPQISGFLYKYVDKPFNKCLKDYTKRINRVKKKYGIHPYNTLIEELKWGGFHISLEGIIKKNH